MDEYKILLIGDCGVGKTSIVERLINNSFTDTIQSTIGVSDQIYQLDCNGSTVELRFVDIPGQIGYDNIMDIYFKGCSFALVVYDITDSETLQNMKMWISKFKENANEYSDILIVGNKCDKKDQIPEEIIIKEIENLGIDYDSRYINISAKYGTNFSYFLSSLSSLIEDSRENDKIRAKTETVDITQKPTNNKCCKS